jgi:hypothetical protein
MRDVRIGDAVLDLLGAARAAGLRAGPEPGLFACATCDLSADADLEPVSVLVVRHPSTAGGRVINILFAHAACSPSAVTESDTQIDVELILGQVNLIPTLIGGGPESSEAAGLVMEPRFPVLESVDLQANAHMQMFLSEGLHLLGLSDIDFDRLAPAPGWRAVLAPGTHPDQTRVTILCGHHEPRVVASDVGIRPGSRWLDLVEASGSIALYAGLIGMLDTPDRDTMTLIHAIGKAALEGNLTGGLIEAVNIALLGRGREVGGEPAGGDRSPAVDVDPDQRLVLPAHGLPVLIPVRVLPGDAPVVVHERLQRLGHVEDLGVPVDLHVRAVPVIGQDTDRHLLVAPQVVGLGPVGIGRDHDPAVRVDATGDGGQLRGAAGPRGDEQTAVPGPQKLQQRGAFGLGRRCDCHIPTINSFMT